MLSSFDLEDLDEPSGPRLGANCPLTYVSVLSDTCSHHLPQYRSTKSHRPSSNMKALFPGRYPTGFQHQINTFLQAVLKVTSHLYSFLHQPEDPTYDAHIPPPLSRLNFPSTYTLTTVEWCLIVYSTCVQ